MTDVLAAGLSAGAMGVCTTAQIITEKLPPDVKLGLIADSCPPMDAQFVRGCLQEQWRELWGFDTTFLADCGSYCPEYDNYMIDTFTYLMEEFEDRDLVFAVLTSTEDMVIRFFYGFGDNDCHPENPILPSMSPETYRAGIMDLHNRLKEFPQTASYIISGTGHGYLSFDDKFYNLSVDGVRLVDWAAEVIAGNASHVGPE